ncbi:hypothetical protein Tco_0889792, partial [Tanacetum coccineum]
MAITTRINFLKLPGLQDGDVLEIFHGQSPEAVDTYNTYNTQMVYQLISLQYAAI